MSLTTNSNGFGLYLATSSGLVDPIADYAFVVRLQTHVGDNVPLGLYQDTACTIPAINDFDPVAAWKDELSGSGFVATQEDPDKQFVLTFYDGVPVIESDGIDDCLSFASSFGPVWIAAREKYLSSNFGRLTAVAGSGNGGFLWFGDVWRARYAADNISLGAQTAGYDALFLQGGVGTSRTSLNGSLAAQPDNTIATGFYSIGDYQSGGGQALGLGLTAIYFGSLALDASAQTVLENYTATLIP